MQHTEMGLILLTTPRSYEESKESTEEDREAMTTQNGEGFVMTTVAGAPTTEDSIKGPIDHTQIRLKTKDWSPDQPADPNLPHCHRSVYVQSVNLNDRFYIFQNVCPQNKRAIRIIDPNLGRLFDI